MERIYGLTYVRVVPDTVAYSLRRMPIVGAAAAGTAFVSNQPRIALTKRRRAAALQGVELSKEQQNEY